jgi:hypothetical protein
MKMYGELHGSADLLLWPLKRTWAKFQSERSEEKSSALAGIEVNSFGRRVASVPFRLLPVIVGYFKILAFSNYCLFFNVIQYFS